MYVLSVYIYIYIFIFIYEYEIVDNQRLTDSAITLLSNAELRDNIVYFRLCMKQLHLKHY